MLSDSTVYLDHACATPVRREVLDKILPVLCNFTGAAGASHAASRRADVLITEARRAVRSCLGAEQGSLRFTEGGGSASQSAILGLALSRGRNGHILTTRDEDEGVLAACRTLEILGFRVTYLEPGAQGALDLSSVDSALCEDTVLATISGVNRFTGCVQPIRDLARLFRSRGILFHTEASLSCILDLDVESWGVDAVTLSTHLIGGPQAVGALWMRPGLELNHPCLECRDLAAIRGFAQALCFLSDERSDWVSHFRNLRSCFLSSLSREMPGSLCCETAENYPAILTVLTEGESPRELVYQLDRLGVCAAETPYGVRFSFARTTTREELETAVKALARSLRRLDVLRTEAA